MDDVDGRNRLNQQDVRAAEVLLPLMADEQGAIQAQAPPPAPADGVLVCVAAVFMVDLSMFYF